MQQQLEMDVIRNEARAAGVTGETMGQREISQNKSLQQRLEQLVAVHRQLLRKFASLELENNELCKKLLLRDERIRQLESNAKALTQNLRQQADRHIINYFFFPSLNIYSSFIKIIISLFCTK